MGRVNVSAVTFAGALATALDARDQQARLAVHFCTTHSVVEASESARLRAALDQADVVAPDGMPLVWLGRLQRRKVERVCGPDFMAALMDHGRARGYRHYLYGGAPGTAELLAAKMRERFPGLQIVGLASPPFRPLSNAEDAAAVAAINETHADCVWVGLGAPKQDVWVAEHRERLSCALVLAVGAAFDFHAGRKRRAPGWMQRSGTEWIFRFLTEPRRLGPRYLVTSVKFAGLLASAAVGLLLRRRAPPDSRRTG